ncbi:DUF6443 domain-containing protein [Tenacibaculum sp.]|uniref:DUF6443 domain-containing protein n=1 Tax=Tenacibaculum sp. TaxID=1906242 RepID=UPI003AA80236
MKKNILLIIVSLFFIGNLFSQTLPTPIDTGEDSVWYRDADGDGLGNPLITYRSATRPNGYVFNDLDCDDSDPNATFEKSWYRDNDGDGLGDSNTRIYSCKQPSGYISTGGDCDDSNSSLPRYYYRDNDGDGYGDKINRVLDCSEPSGYVSNFSDCNDSDATLPKYWYLDSDNDGYGGGGGILYCSKPEFIGPDGQPLFYSNKDGDCNNNNPEINPLAIEISDGIDNNCDGQIDENSSNNNPDDSIYSTNENYTFTRTYQKPMTSSKEIVSNKDVLESITYFDGLGRAKQSIAIQAGGVLTSNEIPKDIVTHITYDPLGRKAEEYLPYATTTNNGNITTGDVARATKTFYQAKYAEDFPNVTDVNEVNAYSKKEFDGSPLNRVLKQAAPGEAWRLRNGHEIEFDYDANLVTEVKAYKVSVLVTENTYIPTLIGGDSNYEEGELYKTVTKDENWTSGLNHTTEEFKNKEGQVILKRTYNNGQKHDTYYVYDDFGNLTYVLPPKVEAQADKPTTTELNELCYQYVYDYKNRLVEKKIPGKGWEYIVYDQLNRPVLNQDANLRSVNNTSIVDDKKWLFTKYDVFGRVIYTGIYTHSSIINREEMQTYFDNQNSSKEKYYEEKLTSSGVLGVYYSSSDFPNTNLEVLTVNYYDDYTFNREGNDTSVSTVHNVSSTTRLQGLTTGSKVKVLGVSPEKWVTTITYYDEKARPIYVYSKNDELKTIDIVENKLDFTGKPIEVRTTHKRGGQEAVVIVDSFIYDHSGRLLSQQQCIGDVSLISCSNEANSTDIVFSEVMTLSEDKIIVDNNSITLKEGFQVIAETGKSIKFTISEVNGETIVSNQYDELGQLKAKKIGGNLQKIDYEYNIRGWLKKINEDDDATDNDLFNFSINYNNPQNGATPLYNGNISETSWNTLNTDTSTRSYSYEFDALNRLVSATGNIDRYDLSSVTYDKNGNIKTLVRKGHLNIGATSFGTMDDLTYSYDSGNKLLRISDGATTDQFGFKDDVLGSTVDTTDDYTYDANGNMLTDTNKGITSNITYNHLNLPVQINVGGQLIKYTYDASGAKLKKVSNGVTTEYSGGFRYVNGALKDFKHAEGYVKKDGSSFNYVYSYTDHLGNVRLNYSDLNNDGVIQAATEILDEKNYYPFGGTHEGYNTAINGAYYPFGYNGKEENDENGLATLDFGARNYDKWAGRWMNIDNKAEAVGQIHSSPFGFALNKPTNLTDPDGDCPPGINCENVLDGMERVRVNRASNLGAGYTRNNGRKWHAGHDLYAPAGSNVRASMSGKVHKAGTSSSYGNYVTIKTTHTDHVPTGEYTTRSDGTIIPETKKVTRTYYTFYAHLESTDVKTGDTVKAGQKIGAVGTTGNANGLTGNNVHLHFEIGTELRGKNNPFLKKSKLLDANTAYKDVFFKSQDESGNQSITGVVRISKDKDGNIIFTFQNFKNTTENGKNQTRLISNQRKDELLNGTGFE